MLRVQTSPVYWYFSSALPRMLLSALPFAAIGAAVQRSVLPYAAIALTFVLLYSALPHKVRFLGRFVGFVHRCAFSLSL